MNKYIALLVSALLAVIVVLMVSRLRSENQLLREAREQAEQARSEMDQAVESARQHESEAQSLRIEVARLRGEAQRVRQTLENAAASQRPISAGQTVESSSPLTARLAGLNQVLLEYIGEPVEPPVNLDARYTKEGLAGAVQFAAQNAGVSVQRVEVEGSEYPFLLGVFCDPQAYTKLLDELKKLDGYEYNGGVGGSDNYHALNITPMRAYPATANERIGRRLMLRQQVFYKSLSAQK